MTARPDLALPLHSASTEDAPVFGPWVVAEREPSDLIALWPADAGDAAPTLEVVLDLLAKHVGKRPEVLEANPPHRESDVLWSTALRLPTDQHVLVWSEPMREMSSETVDFLKARGVKWVLGVQAMLNPDDPLSDFLPMLRMLARGIPDSPAILNVNTEAWHTRAELNDDIFAHDIDPRTSILWIVHGVSDGPDEHAGAWLYTRGLIRCGLPELEILNVPVRRARTAVGFLNSLAELVYERGLPAPGEPFEIGYDLEVAFQPWSAVAGAIPDEVRGSATKRLGHDGQPLIGVRAAVCAVDPIDGRWVWPEEILDRLEGEEPAALFQTARETECRGQRARITWDDLTRAFTALRTMAGSIAPDPGAPEFVIKAGFERPGMELLGSPPDREHLWFDVLRFDGERVQGRLLNQPMFVPGLRRDDVRWIERERLSDWRVTIPQIQSTFGPEHVKHLRQAIFTIKASHP